MRKLPPLIAFALLAVLRADEPASPVGREAGAVRLPDASGKERTLAEFSEAKAVVLVFVSTQCPISNRYLPELGAMAKEYADRGVVVLAANPNRNEQGEIEAHAKERGVLFPVLRDADHALADRFGIVTIPTALVLDGKRVVRYRGRIDDDPMSGRPRRRDLREALDAVLAGREVDVPETEPRGCSVRRSEPAKDGEVTYSRDVAPILAKNCVSCHRKGQIAPFPLTDFEHASAFAKEIRAAVGARRMPPWLPTGGLPLLGERRLNEEETALLTRWADLGTPRGNPDEDPALPEFKDEWMLGTPDLILEPQADFEIAADGVPDVYRHFVIPYEGEDVWVQSTEIRPGNPRVVHHVLVYIDTTGTAKKLDAVEEGEGYAGSGTWPGFVPTGELGGWAPGNVPRPVPDGVGRLLKKGSSVVLQIHYNKCGTAQKDRTRLGLFFAKKPVKRQLRWAEIVNAWFEIPAGAKAHEVRAEWRFPRDATILGATPHQHLLGKSVKMEAVYPDGTKVLLVDVARWDFKWQDSYLLKEPLRVPKGTKIVHTAVYDNSEENPANPSRPPVAVRWGERTSDEMCLGYVGYVLDSEDLTKETRRKGKR
jgi:peroxiredoxin